MGIEGLLRSLSPILIPENEDYAFQHQHTTTGMNATCNNRNNNVSKQRRSNKKVSKQQHNIRQLANKTLAIDASSWLFKASYSCAERLVESQEKMCFSGNNDKIDKLCESRLCNYMVKRCEELITHASIKRIYLVFDGKRSPLKERTNQERERKRIKNLKEARMLKSEGKHELAQDKYRACVKVMDWMGRSVDDAIKKKWGDGGNRTVPAIQFAPPKVSCVFSPYEADAQLVKLCIDGLSDAIVTEDSDVLVYTAACHKSIPIIYKLSRDDGSCDILSMDWLFSCHEKRKHSQQNHITSTGDNQCGTMFPSIIRYLPSNKDDKSSKGRKKGSALLYHLRAMYTRESRQKGAGARMFIQACVLSGCDYCPNRLSGVGFITACKMVKENAHRDADERFQHILNTFPKDKILPDDSEGDDQERRDNGEIERANHQKSTPQIKLEDVPQFIQAYETLLAKSEATFYYHKVQSVLSGQIASLIQPLPCGEKQNLMDEGCSKKSQELDRFLPTTVRFNGDLSFTGIVTQCTSTFTSSTSSFNMTKRKSPSPSKSYMTKKKSFFLSNDNKRLKLGDDKGKTFSQTISNKTKTANKHHSLQKGNDNDGPNGAFSQFAFASSTRRASMTINAERPKDENNNISRLNDNSPSQAKKRHTNLEGSDSDSDLLDDKIFYGKKIPNLMRHPIITPNVKGRQLTQTSQSAALLTYASSTPWSAVRSKYFTFDYSNRDDNCYIPEQATPQNTRVPLVTPKDSRQKAGTIIDSSRSTTHADELLCDDESSNDCVIIEKPSKNLQISATSASSKTKSFLQKNSITNFFEKYQHQNSTAARSNVQTKSSFTSFSKAQFEGTRAKVSNTSKVKKISQKKVSNRQQGKISSIKGFFIPLKTAKEK